MTLEEQIAALTASVNEGRAAINAKFDALQASFDNWKPVVADLQGQVEALRVRIERYAPYFEGSAASTPTAEADVDPGGRAAPRPTDGVAFGNVSEPSGHRQQHDIGRSVLGPAPGTIPPVTGVNLLTRPGVTNFDLTDGRDHRASHHNWALPKLDFPSFDGDNPQFCRCTKCEKYFAVYGLQSDLWVRVATLHFTGNAARWLQVQEKKGTVWGWDSLCSMLFEKFGREHYQNLLRQFNNLKQQGTVPRVHEPI
jgi:hypothetical protein